MLVHSGWVDITAWEWPADLIAWAAVITATGIIWRSLIWPGMKTLWAAVKAAPKIADGVGEVVHLIESDVLGKLEDIKVEAALHAEQARGRDNRLDHHTVQLESYSLALRGLDERVGKLEAAQAKEPLE